MTTSVVRVLVVADTHLTAGTLDRMPAEVWSLAGDADHVLHAGDLLDRSVLDAFAALAPVTAVLGNNDRGLAAELPVDVRVELGGVAVAMVHDSGPTKGRERRLARAYPEARVVVFGHSHQPLVLRTDGGPLLLNPGSPVQRRRQPVHTVGWLELADGEVRVAEIREVGPLADRR